MEKLFLLGHPIGHSKSPAMHNAAYRALGLDWEYALEDLATAAEAQAFLAECSWIACNVTMPYKPLAYEASRMRSAAATLAQGANVLVKTRDGLVADNTDGMGCVSYLERCGISFTGAQVVVCGTGPTSRAIMHASAVAGASAVVLMGRDADRAKRTVAAYAEQLGQVVKAPIDGLAFNDAARMEALRYAADCTQFAGTSYEMGKDALAAADLIVDATSLGMSPDDPAPFDVGLLRQGQVVFDVVYGHGETALMAAAHEVGCQAFNGEGMLVAQAVETVRDIAEATGAFEIPPSVDLFDVMARAAGFDL